MFFAPFVYNNNRKKWTVNMTQYKIFFDVHCVCVGFFVRSIPITSRKMIHGQSRMTLDFQTKQKWVWKKQNVQTHTSASIPNCFDLAVRGITQDDVTAIFRSWFWCRIRFRIHSTVCSMRSATLRVHWHIFINISREVPIRYDRCYCVFCRDQLYWNIARTHRVVIWNL